MFVDASAIVAILTREPEAEANALTDILETAQAPMTSPIAIFEAAMGICRKRHTSVEEAEQDIGEFLELTQVRTVPITASEAHMALTAFSRYGKGRGIPRNSTWATALLTPQQNAGAALRFKGEDFTKTDIRSAAPPR